MRPENLRAYGALTILVLALGLIATTAQAGEGDGTFDDGTAAPGAEQTADSPDPLGPLVDGDGVAAPGEGLYADGTDPLGPVIVDDGTFSDGSVSFTALPLVEDAVSTGAVSPPSVPVEADPMTVETVIDVEPVFDFAGFAEYMAGAEGIWQ